MNDLTGQKFGRLTVISNAYKVKRGIVWHCRCDCGNEKDVLGARLRNGHTKSCGCYRLQRISETQFVHGDSINKGTRLYAIWSSMKQRCDNKNSSSYKWYGKNGIKICDEWYDYKIFKKWALENGYEDNLSIDRIDSSSNYCPENCRWSTPKIQARNTNRNHYVEIDGVKKCLSEWAEYYNITYSAIMHRLKRGMSPIEALNKPMRKHEGGKYVYT